MAKNRTKSPEIVQTVTQSKAKDNRTFPVPVKLALFLGLVSLMVYANTWRNGFLLDDSVMVTNNHIVSKGISAIPELLSTPHQRGYWAISNDEYRPLSLVLFSVIYELFAKNPIPYHLMNILLFAGCVVLLFLFLDKLFERKKTVVAFLASLLFALHPIHTEVVANIKSSDELLCFFFVFLSLNIFLKYIWLGKAVQLLLGGCCLLLAFLSKETAITFVFIIPLIFFCYRNENKKRSIYITSSIVLAAIVFLFVRHLVLGFYHANNTGAMDLLANMLSKEGLSFDSRIATAILILGYYIKLLFVPYPLICDYSYNTIPFVHFSDPAVLISLAIYIFLAAVGIRRFVKDRKDPYAFGILFFLVTISLFANMLFLIKATAGERFLFFPSVGFCLVVALFLEKRAGKTIATGISVLKSPKIAGVMIPVCLIYAIITIGRNNDWSDNYTLYTTDVKKAPDNCRLNYWVGDQLFTSSYDDHNPSTRKQTLENAIFYFSKAIAIYPDYFYAQSDLGAAYFNVPMYDSAIMHDRRAIEIKPSAIIPANNLSGLYINNMQFNQAIEVSERSIQFAPRNVIAYANIGFSYLNLNKFDSAIFYLNKGILIDPGFNSSYEIIATAYKAAGNMDSANKYAAIAQINDPRFRLK